MRVAFLGPGGHLLRGCPAGGGGERRIDARPAPTVYDAIRAVGEGEADRALVPFENSIEGSVRSTLDTLAFEAPSGDDRGRARPADPHQPDRPHSSSPWSEIEVVSRTPRRAPSARGFIREELPGARGPGRAQHGRGGARGRRSAASPGRRSGRRRPPRSTAASSCARGSRTARQRDPVRLDRPGRDAGRRATGRGGPRSSSPSSAPTIRARWSRR